MTIDLFERYTALDPVKEPETEPQWTSIAPGPLPSDDRRESNMQTQQKTSTQPNLPKQPRTAWLVAGSMFVVVLIVGAGVLISNQSDTDVPSAQTPTTMAAERVIAETTITPAEALDKVNAFYVAYNAAEPDAVLALFSADALFSSNFEGSTTKEEAEMEIVWGAAQGTKLTSEGCTVEQVEPAESLIVECVGVTSDALSQVLGARGVPTRVVMVVTPEHIRSIEYRYGQPDFEDKGIPFDTWMDVHNPDDAEATSFGTWTTVDEASESGRILAQYAEEWKQYLDENGCTYLDDC